MNVSQSLKIFWSFIFHLFTKTKTKTKLIFLNLLPTNAELCYFIGYALLNVPFCHHPYTGTIPTSSGSLTPSVNPSFHFNLVSYFLLESWCDGRERKRGRWPNTTRLPEGKEKGALGVVRKGSRERELVAPKPAQCFPPAPGAHPAVILQPLQHCSTSALLISINRPCRHLYSFSHESTPQIKMTHHP